MDPFILVAILVPFIFGFINVFDKYIVSHKIKNPMGYTAVAGAVNLLLGLVIALFLTWNNVEFVSLLFPVLAGFFAGWSYYLYFFIMKKSDASYFIGLAYLFPIVVALLSFFFLNERLSLASYLAVAIILFGVILLSIRIKKIKMGFVLLPFLVYIFVLGAYEFFVKVSTNHVSLMQGLSVTTAASGVAILFGLANKSIRSGFVKEFKNIKWAFAGEIITLIGLLTLYFAMSGLSATVVSSIAAIQPLAVILFEWIAHARFGKMTQDLEVLPKLGAILLIVLGVLTLSILNS